MPGAEQARTTRIQWLLLGLAVSLGLALRTYWVLVLHPPAEHIFSDMSSYVDRAKSLLAGHYQEWDWIYPPGTSVWLVPWMKWRPDDWKTCAGVVQLIVGTVEIALVFFTARRWFGSRVALIAAFGFAFHPLAISYCGLFSSEHPLTFWLILAAFLFDPEKPANCGFAGLALGFACLVKPQSIVLVGFWALFLAFRKRWPAAIAMCIAAVAPVIPESYAATKALKELTIGSAMGGVVMVQGWCPASDVTATGNGWGMGFGLPEVHERRSRGEAELDWPSAHFKDVTFVHSKFYAHAGVECIKRFKGHALRTAFRNVFDAFAGFPWSPVAPWPDADNKFHKWSFAANMYLSWLVAPFALIGIWRARRHDGIWVIVVLPVLSCVATCIAFHGEPRFRVPYDFAIFIGAAVGITRLIDGESDPGIRVHWGRVILALGVLFVIVNSAIDLGQRIEAHVFTPMPAMLDGKVELILYDNANFQGDKLELGSSIRALNTRDFNDRATSIRVRTGSRTTFFQHDDFQGAWFTYNCPRTVGDFPQDYCEIPDLGQISTGLGCFWRDEGKFACKPWWNDQISSVRIEGPSFENQRQGRIAESGLLW